MSFDEIFQESTDNQQQNKLINSSRAAVHILYIDLKISFDEKESREIRVFIFS